MYSPTTSQTLASNSGSVENSNVSARHGYRSHYRQILATVAFPIPGSFASSREDQCVTPSLAGGLVSVATTTSFCEILRGRPGLSRSRSAASPPIS